jgi:hypothetical protein
MSEYPKGIIDLRRLMKKNAVSIEPGRRHWYVPESRVEQQLADRKRDDERWERMARLFAQEHANVAEQCKVCGTPGYTEEGLCEDCFIEIGD